MRPGLDDKRLAAWNALMIAALADAGAVLGREDYLDAARDAAAFVLDAHARRPTAACCAPSTPATARLGAYLEDHAFLLEALLVLYEATFEERWFVEARALADTIVARFGDPERGGFFSTSDDHEPLDRAAQGPRGRADPVGRLERRARACCASRALTGERALRGAGRGPAARCCTRSPSRHPGAFGHLLQALDFYLAPRREVALAGDPAGVAALAAVVREARRPHLVLAGGPGDGPTAVALMEQRTPVDGRAAAYVCERFACRTPVTEPDELRALLRRTPSACRGACDCRSSGAPDDAQRCGIGVELARASPGGCAWAMAACLAREPRRRCSRHRRPERRARRPCPRAMSRAVGNARQRRRVAVRPRPG